MRTPISELLSPISGIRPANALIGAAIYNVLAEWIGDIEVEVEQAILKT